MDVVSTPRGFEMHPMLRSAPRLLASLLVAGFASTALAQTNVQWVTFQNDTATRLAGLTSTVSSGSIESDMDAGDLDLDGWLDIVIVRKQPTSLPGKRSNVVLLNDINHSGGFLNVTSTKANTSTFVGSSGMLDLTDDRDVDVVDLNNDGKLDFVTTVTLSDGDPKYISHPRVYMNQGFAPDNSWNGVLYVETAIPQLISNVGQAAAPRFCECDPADVNEDGFLDLYFVDYDDTETGIMEDPLKDLDDRLLTNDGAGNFTDSVNTRMTASQRTSAFGVSCALADFNGDGHVDILKDTTLQSPTDVRLIYNNPLNIGHFNQFNGSNQTWQSVGSSQPYGIKDVDLNQDGRIDFMQADDSLDRYRLNNGNDAFGKVSFGPLATYQFVSANGDDTFGNDNYAFDLDGDGWNDGLVTDFDKDVSGCSRRMHIYHNTTPHTVGGTVTMKEEAQNTDESGWKGVVGPTVADLQGTYDVLVRDFDNDGDLDMVLARCSGGSYWSNTRLAYACQIDMGFGNGGGTLVSCGAPLTSGKTSQLELSGAPANGVAHVFAGLSWSPTTIPGTAGGQLGPFAYALYLALPTNGQGSFTITIPGGGVPSATSIYLQMITTGAGGTNPRMTNGLRLDFAP